MRLLGRPSRLLRPLAALPVVLLTLLLAAGCGDDGTGVGQDPDPDDLPDTSDAGEPQTVEILSGVATGGSTDQDAVWLSGPGSRGGVGTLTRELTRPDLAREVRRVVRETDVPDGMALAGGIVSVGCDVPSDVEVSAPMGAIELEPVWTGVTRLQECFAPVTSIAIVLVDWDLGRGNPL